MRTIRHYGDITKIDGTKIEPVDGYKVYKYTFPDGKVYIGTTKNTLQKRKDCGYQHNKGLTTAIRKVGWGNVQKEIIASGLNQAEAFEEEKRQISLHNSQNPANGYNISFGGKSTFAGLKHTQAHREKMSKLYRGKVWSEESLRRMSEGHKKERKPVVRVSLSGEINGRYESLGAAAQAVNGHKSNISRACKSGNPYKGFRWEFENQSEVMIG